MDGARSSAMGGAWRRGLGRASVLTATPDRGRAQSQRAGGGGAEPPGSRPGGGAVGAGRSCMVGGTERR